MHLHVFPLPKITVYFHLYLNYLHKHHDPNNTEQQSSTKKEKTIRQNKKHGLIKLYDFVLKPHVKRYLMYLIHAY
jgi:hypothetical protein